MENIKIQYEQIGLNNIKNIPTNFNWQYYLDHNPDVRSAGFDTEHSAIAHYLLHGQHENRQFHPPGPSHNQYFNLLPENFDYRLYRVLNPDLQIFTTQKDLENHYISHGRIENRKYSCGLSYNQIMSIKNNQLNFNLLKPTILLVNHDSSLTGAPILLQDIANWMDNHHFSNIVFVDAVPNTFFKLNDNIKQIYHFNDENILLDIINNTMPILIYSNSLNPIVKNPKLFNHILYKTIFHLHECYSDIISYINNYNTYKHIIYNSKNIIMAAPQIVADSDLIGIDKVKIVPSFIPKEKIKLISKYKKTKKITHKFSDKVVICMCGSICDRKNPQLFIYLAKMNPHYQFIWIGGDLGIELPNLKCIKQTNNPYQIFNQIDYFFLTSIRDPCPVVVLENLLMNNKIILLENNIKYNHDISKLENVFIIRDHNNNFTQINHKFQQLTLNKTFNQTNKNVQYIKKYFSTYNVIDTTPTEHKSHIILSFYNKANEDLNYYTNSINQQLLFNKNITSITISIADDDGLVSRHFLDQINHNNIIINHRKNAGWDIGGLINSINNSLYHNSDYIIYIHNKKNILWKQELYKILYYHDYFKYNSVVSKQYYIPCDINDKNRELFKIHKFMSNAYDASFNYISGTCFITKYDTLRNLADNSEYILNNLTDINTNDVFWQSQMLNKLLFDKCYKDHMNHPICSHIDEDAREVFLATKSKNYFELLHKHNKKGLPDYTFEHALERYIGYLIQQKENIKLI